MSTPKPEQSALEGEQKDEAEAPEAATEDVKPVAEEPVAEEPAADEAPVAEEAADDTESDVAPVHESGGPDHNWYVVQTYSGFESRVQQSLTERVKAAGMEDKVAHVLVPSEEVLEIRGGKKRKSSRKFFPGYVLVEANLTDEVWHLIKEIPKVTGFVGGRHPQPLEPDEVNSLLYQMETGVRPPRPTADFSVGDKVRIIEGPFSGFVASVDEVIESQSKLKVMVTIFGRSTPVELGFLQVEAA